MATITDILPTDNATDAVGKINTNFSNLNNSEGSGSTPAVSDVITRNTDALQRISAAKKHVMLSKTGVGVNFRNTMNNFCIAHGSDFHTDKTRWRNFLDFAQGVDGIQAILNTGDFAAQAGIGETDYMMTELDNAGVTKPIMLVVGNHDRYGTSNAQLDGKFKMATRNTSIHTTDTNHLYYYIDYPNKNNEAGTGTYIGEDKPTPNIDTIRFIVLNQYDMTSTDSSKLGKGYHFTQAQINWFISVLENTPNTTAVVVCMHGFDGLVKPVNTGNKKFYQRYTQWVRSSSGISYNGTIIEDIIEAFRTGTNISKSFAIADNDDATVTVTTDFSGTGTFIAYMIGHSHIEMIGYSSAHPNQLYLHCPCSCLAPDYNNSGVYQGNDIYSYGNEVGDMPRSENNKSQDCFNVYGIDTVNKTVTVVRVGCTTNDLGQPRDIDVYPYDKAPS